MAWVFVQPPNWPEPPPDWTPAPGWQPNPEWGPAPEGWEFWQWREDAGQAPEPHANLPAPVDPPSAALSQTSDASITPTETKAPGFLARRRAQREERASAQQDFDAVATSAAAGDPQALAALPNAVKQAREFYRDREWDKKRFEVAAQATRQVIADDILTREEEAHVSALLEALAIEVSDFAQRNLALYEELMIARINDGRLPVVSQPAAVLKKGEIAHGEFSAALMKEVVRREYRGGSSGVSVPIGFGMRYRTSSFRGKSVVVGTELVTADSGEFVVTNQRALFVGTKKTLEFRFDRLVGLEQFRDGLRLNVSNRQAASLLKIPRMPAMAAALISRGAAAQ